MNSFFHNIFGTIAGSSSGLNRFPNGIDFIPKDDKGGIVKIRGNSAIWMGLRNPLMQLYAYEYCYPVGAVFDRLAEYDIAVNPCIVRSKGKGKDDFATNSWAVRMNSLLEQPNPLQSWEQFRGQQIVYKKIFGFCPVLPIVPSGFNAEDALAMINLPPWLFDVEGTKKLIGQSAIDGVIKNYKFTLFGQTTEFTPDKLFILTDSFLQNVNKDMLLPQSRLIGLDFAVSNLCAAMEADNVLLKKKGPLGFISDDIAASKDGVAGSIPMTKRQKLELQRSLSEYGLSMDHFQYVISRRAMKWNPMSYDVKQLGTKETVVAAEKAVCHRYNYPFALYEQTESTFSNGANASVDVYETNVIPNNVKDINKYNKFFKASENQCKIVTDFSSISALQEDKLNKARSTYYEDQGLAIEFTNNIITMNEWRVARGYDSTLDGDVYYKDMQPQQQVDINKVIKDNNQPPQ